MPRHDDVDTEYMLTRDDEGHWFVIPAAYRDEWSAYLDAVADGEYPIEPDWSAKVDGPHRVRFWDWKEE